MTDLDNLSTHIQQHYSQDEVFQRWIKHYAETGRVELNRIANPSTKNHATASQKTTIDKKEKIRLELENSYTEERFLTDEVTPNFTNAKECIETIKNCDRLIKSGNLSNLRHSAMQGEALFHLKKKVIKGKKISTFLTENHVPFSESHCRSLISLFKLINEHQTLLKCSLSVRYILRNITLIREICTELKW